MNNEELDQKLQEALALKDQGKTYSEIREHFKQDLDADTISYIIRLVDEFAIEEDRIKSEIRMSKFKVYVGIVAVLLTLTIALKLLGSEATHGIKKLAALLPLVFSGYFLFRSYKEVSSLKNVSPEIDDNKFRLIKRLRRQR